MAIFASTTLGSSDPSRAQSIKALEARAQALAAAQAKQEAPTSLPSPWQGAGLVMNQAADAFATKRADQAAEAGRQDLANTIAQVGPEGPNPQQQARIMMRDTDVGKTYMQEIAARRAAAAEVAARKEAAAEAVKAHEAAAVAQENRVQARPTDEVAIVNKEVAAGRMSEEEGKARKERLLAPPINEQKYTDEMQEKSVAGQALLGALDEASALANSPTGIHAGPQAGNTQTIGENMPGFIQRAVPSLTPDPKVTEDTQRFNQIMGEQALDLLTKMKGASSDKDVAINFKIVNDPNATLKNKQIALARMRDRIATLLQLHNEDIVKRGGKVPTLQKTEPAAAPAAAAAGAPAAAPAAGAGVQSVASEAEALALPSGTRFKLPDGRTGTAR